jgi:hypothetical protein
MFKTNVPVVELAHDDDVTTSKLIPLSHLALDLPEPEVGGWHAYLNAKGVDVVVDDIGRLAVARSDARMLITEHREAEAHAREVTERREAQLIQQDQLRRANMPAGIPAGMVPDGMTGAEAMVLAGEKRRPRSVREQLLEKSFPIGGLSWFINPSARMRAEP